MFITLFIIATVGGVGGSAAVTKVRSRSKRFAAAKASRDAEADAGRKAHPTVQALLGQHGFGILEGRPRPTPQMHGQLSLNFVRTAGGDPRRCEFTHEAIWTARREHLGRWQGGTSADDGERFDGRPSGNIILIEQVAAQGERAHYRQIVSVCQLCLHVFPVQDADLKGTSFEGKVKDHQSLREIVAGIDAAALLEERRAWLREELGEVEVGLLSAAHAAPCRLAEHPHRGHPHRLGPAKPIG